MASQNGWRVILIALDCFVEMYRQNEGSCEGITHLQFRLMWLRGSESHWASQRTHCYWYATLLSFSLSSTNAYSTPLISLKVAQTDKTIRPRFRNGIDMFSTPSSTLKTPASWPPRPALTGLSQTLVADHVLPNFNSFFLFSMVVLNLFETIPSPSPLFIPPRPRREAIRSGFENHTKNGFNYHV